MKNYFNSLKKSVWVVSALCLFVSCNDVWENHYSTDSSIVPDKNLAERIEQLDGTENFIATLKTTKMFNGNKILDLTYYDFLSSDQFLTVWIPSAESVSEEDWALYTKENKTYEENKNVGQQFIKNHIARFNNPVGVSTKERVRMLSKKRYWSLSDNLDGISYKADGMNLPCTNGVLHLLDGILPYRPTIYEYITETPGYEDNLGSFLERFTIDEVDDNRSVISGVDGNGDPIYIDSVTYKYSVVMNKFGQISEEDSNYVVILPTPEALKEMYDSVKKSFDFTPPIYIESDKKTEVGHFEPGTPTVVSDSLTEFYTYDALLTDMFYNMNIQRHPLDSVMSTLYYEGLERVEDEPQHKYYAPYSAEGLFKKNVVDSVICSNGKIYLTDKWSFDEAEIFRRPIKIEAEHTAYIKAKTLTSEQLMVRRDKYGIRVSNERALRITGEQGATGWTITYSAFDNLKGNYKIGLVILNDTLFNNPEMRPVRFTYVVTYNNCELLKSPRREYMGNDITVPIDTVWIPGVVSVPQSNYGQERPKLDIKIEDKSNSSTSSTMYLDCIIVKPVADDYVDPE